MNERIKTFESQCWEPRPYGPAFFNYKKFAEMIVSECATVAQAVDDSNTKNVYQYGAAENIKLHFGVE